MGTIRIVRELLPPRWHEGRADPLVAGAACERRRRLARGAYVGVGLSLGLCLWAMQGPLALVALALALATLAVWVALPWVRAPRFSLEHELAAELWHEPASWSAMFLPGLAFAGAGVPLALALQRLAQLPTRGVDDELLLDVALTLAALGLVCLGLAYVLHRFLRARRLARALLAPGALVWAFGSTWNAARFLNLVTADGHRHAIQLAGDVALATALAALDVEPPPSDYRRAASRPLVGFTPERLHRYGEPPGMHGRRG